MNDRQRMANLMEFALSTLVVMNGVEKTAKRLGVGRSTIYRWKDNPELMPLGNLLMMAKDLPDSMKEELRKAVIP